MSLDSQREWAHELKGDGSSPTIKHGSLEAPSGLSWFQEEQALFPGEVSVQMLIGRPRSSVLGMGAVGAEGRGSARNVLSVVVSADKFRQILRSNIWNSRNSLWGCFCLSYFPGHWSSQSPITERTQQGSPSFLRRNLRNGKQLCSRFERVINKA